MEGEPPRPSRLEATGALLLYSAFTGALAGLGAAFLAWLLKSLTEGVGLLFGYLPPYPPGEGGVLQAFTGPTFPLLFLLLPLAYALVSLLGSGLGLSALLRHAREGVPPPRGTHGRTLLGSLLQLGLYSPMGREGPFGVLGLWLGGVLDRRFPRMGGGLAFAGLAAGLGAALHAPVAGALLATEILYRGLFLEAKALTPALVGALSGFAVYGAFFGYTPLLPFRVEVDLRALPLGLLLGFLGALLSTLWVVGGEALEARLRPLPFPLRHGLLGLTLGLLLLFAPEALGSGLGWVAVATTPLFPTLGLFYLLLLKLLLLVLAAGVRAYGGPYTPALVLGGLMGALLGRLLPLGLPPEALALAGGAALLSGVARAPFAATVLAAEWGGYATLPLVLPAVFLAYALTPPPQEPALPKPVGAPEPPPERPPQSAPPPPAREAGAEPETPPG